MGRRIFVGDVHGHYDGLMALMEAIAPNSGDRVYFVGDLIDRGPKSSAVVEFVLKSGYGCVLGNHEQMLLDAFPKGQISQQALQAWLYSGGQTTVASYDKNEDLLFEHLDWFRTLPTHLDLDDVWLVHAGMSPKLSVAQHTTQEFCWIRDEFHSTTRPYFANKTIITGHTITFTLPKVPPGAIAQGCGWLDIDTGAYHPRSGWLTALDYTTRQVYQANVYDHNTVRVMPLTEAVTEINPSQIVPRHRQLLEL
ncbi:metallophosphoesterase family protein [Leptolyngbya sp. AN02str]|uniref:metallophosphoesterase family protein n=1 Tax=Leptolyngbya sp. AN02str TaxID=3423363 RepID=UPI003D31C6C6